MTYIAGNLEKDVRSELIDYALSAIPSTRSDYDVVTSICQRWQDQDRHRSLTVDQYNSLRRIGHQAVGIAKKQKRLRKCDQTQYLFKW
jgi:hypothetical protein